MRKTKATRVWTRKFAWFWIRCDECKDSVIFETVHQQQGFIGPYTLCKSCYKKLNGVAKLH